MSITVREVECSIELFFVLLMWIPLSVWSTYCAYVMQLDDTEYQRDVNRIVEKGCGDNHAFDSDDDGDDNDEKETYVDSVGDIKAKLLRNKLKNQSEVIRTDDNNE
eukprot:428760_1